VRGCWGSDFSHFYRGVQLLSEASRSSPWENMQLTSFGLADANKALESVATGKVLKALIDPDK